jgi:hypothetical protein
MTIYYGDAFNDAYLAKFCTSDRQVRATADVATVGTFPAAWEQRLVVCRTYILACQEHQAEADDLFSVKLKTYRGEWDRILPLAQAAQNDEDDVVNSGGVFSIPLERA